MFHENYVAISIEFKTWTDIHRVSSRLDLDLDLGDVISNFDGFTNIPCQCLDQEEIECEEQEVEDRLTTAENVPKKNAFSLMTSTKRVFVDEKKETSLNRNDESFNGLLKLCKTSPVDFSSRFSSLLKMP